MNKAGKTETCIGFFIITVLVGIAAIVLTAQSRYDPSLFRALEIKGYADSRPGQAGLSSTASRELAAFAPEGIVPLGDGEIFDSNTLSDKINGKAELYLSAGFVRLATQRFSRKSDQGSWLEVFVYDMGNLKNAFSVYSVQKRKDSRKSDIGTFAYSTENALFFVNGSKYVEVVSADSGMAEEMDQIAGKLIASEPAQTAEGMEFVFFPSESLDETSISLHMSDVFGFDRLDQVYTARYRVGETEVSAFLSKRHTPDESAALAAEYCKFLAENGGVELGEVSGIPGSRLFQVFDTYEAVLHVGVFFAGTHEVETRSGAEEIAGRLYKKLEEAAG